jgi:hypothetical protein
MRRHHAIPSSSSASPVPKLSSDLSRTPPLFEILREFRTLFRGTDHGWSPCEGGFSAASTLITISPAREGDRVSIAATQDFKVLKDVEHGRARMSGRPWLRTNVIRIDSRDRSERAGSSRSTRSLGDGEAEGGARTRSGIRKGSSRRALYDRRPHDVAPTRPIALGELRGSPRPRRCER